jgi:hypothetical protein
MSDPMNNLDRHSADSYRVFVSYSHGDRDHAETVVDILESNGLRVLWDKHFKYGHGFQKEIRTFIAHAHAFLPLITPGASQRGWVHQEIGYAMALNVPILPVTVDIPRPGEMLADLHAIQVGVDLNGLETELSKKTVADLVAEFRDTKFAQFESAELPEDRARMLAEYTEQAFKLNGGPSLVRQKGALSSFHIPNVPINDAEWRDRWGEVPRSEFLRKQQLRERKAFQRHAEGCGCRIMIDPLISYKAQGPAARLARLTTLLRFLENADDNTHVAIFEEKQYRGNLTIVGDWFAAESVSVSSSKGYRQTIFTRHAPSMVTRIQEFDDEFKIRLAASGWTPGDSRRDAIQLISSRIEQIENASESE